MAADYRGGGGGLERAGADRRTWRCWARPDRVGSDRAGGVREGRRVPVRGGRRPCGRCEAAIALLFLKSEGWLWRLAHEPWMCMWRRSGKFVLDNRSAVWPAPLAHRGVGGAGRARGKRRRVGGAEPSGAADRVGGGGGGPGGGGASGAELAMRRRRSSRCPGRRIETYRRRRLRCAGGGDRDVPAVVVVVRCGLDVPPYVLEHAALGPAQATLQAGRSRSLIGRSFQPRALTSDNARNTGRLALPVTTRKNE